MGPTSWVTQKNRTINYIRINENQLPLRDIGSKEKLRDRISRHE